MQTNTGEWLGRQRSAAGKELKIEASWGEFWNEIQVKRPGNRNETLEMSDRGGTA